MAHCLTLWKSLRRPKFASSCTKFRCLPFVTYHRVLFWEALSRENSISRWWELQVLDIFNNVDSIRAFQSQHLKTPGDFKLFFLLNGDLNNIVPWFSYLQIENNSLQKVCWLKMFIKLFRIACVIRWEISSAMLVLSCYTYWKLYKQDQRET